MKKFSSIRWRLVLSYVLLTLLAVALVGLLAQQLLQQYVHGQTQTQLQANARSIALQAAPLMQPSPRVDELQDMANSLSFLGRVRVRVLDDQSNLIVDSGLPDTTTSVMWVQADPHQQNQGPFLVPLNQRQARDANGAPWMKQAFGMRHSMVMRVEEGAWGRLMMLEAVNTPDTSATQTPAKTNSSSNTSTVSARYPIGSTTNPLGYIQLDSSNTQGDQILAAMRRALLLAGLAAALIAVIAGLLFGRSLSAPLLALAESATLMSNGDLTVRAPERGAGEIGLLARQFNHMASSLQTSFAAVSAERDALRRFIADASHELRTPTTALGNYIELLQGPAANDPAARVEFLDDSQRQVQRMEWIISNLLDLSRLDAGLVQLDRQRHDLGDLLQSGAAPFQALAQEKNIQLKIELPQPPVVVVCDQARIEIALGNLLENALKFTPPGGSIRLRGDKVEGSACFQVVDTGPGIAPQDLPHIFERFYRGSTAQEGSGLGLSIVQGIVQAHGGQVTAESQPRNGTTITITLPDSEARN
ncbi:MAG TPA: HAMP domain-containing sensor histidine kinase [Anaerolineaceae bacterium]